MRLAIRAPLIRGRFLRGGFSEVAPQGWLPRGGFSGMTFMGQRARALLSSSSVSRETKNEQIVRYRELLSNPRGFEDKWHASIQAARVGARVGAQVARDDGGQMAGREADGGGPVGWAGGPARGGPAAAAAGRGGGAEGGA